MAREFSRSDRVASQFHKEIADLLRTEVRDPVLGMVTVSSVEVSKDLAVVKAYVSFLGAKEVPQRCIKHLNEWVPQLRHLLSRRVRMRVMPELRFLHDDSIERGIRMDALLDSLHADTKDTDDEVDQDR
ncbi:MAG: 30S ribosome-binding factor RbfA [Methylococcaceae bacterium]|nr:30S ribosome-binding factor RbfA [Methylococcaceae bacterium]